MSNLRNPFHTLYATEGINELDFPAIFSPTLIPLVLPLFQAGNVMLSGTQGTGKSMLLALLDTDVRLAFWNNEKHAFPVDSAFCRFVGSSINLSSSLVLKFTERDFGGEDSVSRSQAVFSDYLNTWVIRDLLNSIQSLITKAPRERLEESGISTNLATLELAVRKLADTHECGGLIGNAITVAEAVDALSKRQRTYLVFINFRIDEIPKNIWGTITGIGEPLSLAANILRSAKVLESNTEVFVTIDQCEELLRLDQSDSTGRQYGRFLIMLDKLISAREKAVSYRLGTRPNAIWKGKSEEVRDYSRVDLDTLLRGKEYAKTIFPRFARDVFLRRLATCGLAASNSKDALTAYFGNSPQAPERATECAAANKPKRVLGLEKEWPDAIKKLLLDLAERDVLSAKLGEAWIRQNIGSKTNFTELANEANELPWEQHEKQWWRKERRPIAVLQIAARSGERIRYYGKNDILLLSGRNILVFALICQKIWESWVESLDLTDDPDAALPLPFPKVRQDVGIQVASNIWHSKILSAPSGDTLGRFVDTLGTRLRNQLRDDKPMSYPGANGISLTNVEVDGDKEIRAFLDDATSEGFLQSFRHTPKTPSRGKSKKWYLHPILSPYYELTVVHTKEPLYLNIIDLRKWLEKANVVEPVRIGKIPMKQKKSTQQKLFDDGDIE